jgi:uncharacterized coiled-coil DUF342 family protein
MEPTDLTIEILKDIRAEIRTTRETLAERIDATNSRLDVTNERLDVTNERLDSTIAQVGALVQGQTRVRTEILEVASAVQTLTTLFREDRQLRHHVDDHEKRLGSLERRTGNPG